MQRTNIMNVVRKAVSALGGIFLAALLIAALAPKATRGIAAALVQVVNTPANPVQNQDVTTSASQLVTLFCDPVSHGCTEIGPGDNFTGTSYTVPMSQQLVITDMEIETAGAAGLAVYELIPNVCPPGTGISFCEGQTWSVANDGTTHEFHFGRGFVWQGGNSFFVAGSPGVDARMYGYLTTN
jgi:hypothetical protein